MSEVCGKGIFLTFFQIFRKSWFAYWFGIVVDGSMHRYRKNKGWFYMPIKGGSKSQSEYSYWTLLQFCFYYMFVINGHFIEHIKNASSRQFIPWASRDKKLFSSKMSFLENRSISLVGCRVLCLCLDLTLYTLFRTGGQDVGS